MISAIVAVDNDWGIGSNGDLLEHIPEDLKYFKQLTTDKVVVMGRKTWDSLPTKPLPNRCNIVITSTPHHSSEANFWSFETTKLFMEQNNLDFFVIGGGQIYKELLPLCDRVYATKIDNCHECVDTYFPNLDELDDWAPASCSPIYEYKDFTYQFWQYDRI